MKLFLSCAAVAAAAVANALPEENIDFSAFENFPDMPAATSDMSVTVVDNIAYLIGGCAEDQFYVLAFDTYACGGTNGGVTSAAFAYNLADGSSAAIASAPRARYRHMAVAVGDEIYVLGGTDDSESAIPEVDVLDTTTGQWRTEAGMQMTTPVTDGAVFSVGNKIHVCGGYEHFNYNVYNTNQVFDLSNPGLGWTTAAPMLLGRGDFGIVQPELNGNAYAIGGWDATFAGTLSSTEVYDVASDSWSSGPSLVLSRADKAMIASDGVLYVLGGETVASDGSPNPVRDIEYLSVSSDETATTTATTWVQDSHQLGLERFRFGAARDGTGRLFVFGGQGYLTGDYKDNKSYYAVLPDVQVFDAVVRATVADAAPTTGTGFAAFAATTAAAVFGAVW